MNSSSILSFWKNNSGKRCTEADGAFRASLFNLNAARRPARFAPACPQNQRTRFSSANRGPRNPKEGARRSARFAPACPQSQRTRFSSANRGPENPKKGANRPGSAPVNRRPKVKFKLTIQSENLRLNSKCFYHSETD